MQRSSSKEPQAGRGKRARVPKLTQQRAGGALAAQKRAGSHSDA